MINLIFLGAPGSGKGTQAKIISDELSLPIISTGDILRQEVQKESDIGLKAKSFMDVGDLVPDEVIISIIESKLSDSDYNDGFIMDGFPRNLSQAVKLDEMLKSINKSINSVLELDIDQDILVKRMVGRFTCSNCGEIYNKFFKNVKKEGVCDICGSSNFTYRDDDNEETVRSRQDIYSKTSKDLINFYLTKGLIYKLDASKSSDFITKKILNHLSNLKGD